MPAFAVIVIDAPPAVVAFGASSSTPGSELSSWMARPPAGAGASSTTVTGCWSPLPTRTPFVATFSPAVTVTCRVAPVSSVTMECESVTVVVPPPTGTNSIPPEATSAALSASPIATVTVRTWSAPALVTRRATAASLLERVNVSGVPPARMRCCACSPVPTSSIAPILT